MGHAAMNFRGDVGNKQCARLGAALLPFRFPQCGPVAQMLQGRPCLRNRFRLAPNDMAQLCAPVSAGCRPGLVDHQNLDAPVGSILAIRCSAQSKVCAYVVNPRNLLPPSGGGSALEAEVLAGNGYQSSAFFEPTQIAFAMV